MRIISPPCTRCGWPALLISASPSTTCTNASNGAVCFAQSLAFVEGEERHAAGGPLDDLAAHDRAVLVVDEFRGLGHLVAGQSFRFGWGFWFHNSSLSIASLVGGCAGSQSDQSMNSVVVARESNTPEPSCCHRVVHFRKSLQHLGAIPRSADT